MPLAVLAIQKVAGEEKVVVVLEREPEKPSTEVREAKRSGNLKKWNGQEELGD